MRLFARLLICAVRVWQELMTRIIAGKWLSVGHYRDKKPVSKNLFLSASMALSRLGHKAMFTRLSTASFRRSAEIVGRIFFVKVGSVLVGSKLRGKLW